MNIQRRTRRFMEGFLVCSFFSSHTVRWIPFIVPFSVVIGDSHPSESNAIVPFSAVITG